MLEMCGAVRRLLDEASKAATAFNFCQQSESAAKERFAQAPGGTDWLTTALRRMPNRPTGSVSQSRWGCAAHA